LLRTRARVVRRHGDGGEIDVGQRRDRQQLVRDDAEHEHAQHQQRGCDRAADEGFGDTHLVVPPSVAAEAPGGAVRMRAPSVNRNWPQTRTRSPGTSPLAPAATPSWTAATSIAFRCTVSPGATT